VDVEALHELESKLRARKDELIREGDLAIEPNRADATANLDEDVAPHTENAQVIASRRNRERAREIAGIEKALRRIASDPDEYGLCDDCGEPIPQKRLEIMPWVEFCVKCQSKHDSNEKNYRRKHAADYV
jgi:DnaK suppressor protein